MAPGSEAFRRGRIAALVSAELFALEQALIIAATGRKRVEFLEANQLAIQPSIVLALTLAAVLAGAIVALSRSRLAGTCGARRRT